MAAATGAAEEAAVAMAAAASLEGPTVAEVATWAALVATVGAEAAAVKAAVGAAHHYS